MKNVLARVKDFFDYFFNRNVVKDQINDDEKFLDLQVKYKKLKEKYEKVQRELEIITLSRDRYLSNCKKKTVQIKDLKNKLKIQEKRLNVEEKHGQKSQKVL